MIVQSKIISANPQSDGFTYIREEHLDSDGNLQHVEYSAPPGFDTAQELARRAEVMGNEIVRSKEMRKGSNAPRIAVAKASVLTGLTANERAAFNKMETMLETLGLEDIVYLGRVDKLNDFMVAENIIPANKRLSNGA